MLAAKARVLLLLSVRVREREQVVSVAYILFTELRPEVWQSEDLLEEDVVFGARAGPLVELVHDVHVGSKVANRLDREDARRHAVHGSLPVLVRRVERLRFPERH